MKLPEIDFSRIRPLGAEGMRSGFEQFVCELAAEDCPAEKARFVSLHGAGGDGGVECFWTLPDGTEHGWQAKYWVIGDAVDKQQLDKSVSAALDVHPQLTKYVIAIPVDPTGPTVKRDTKLQGGATQPRPRERKSLHEKVYGSGGWLDNWKEMAADRDMAVTFEVEWATNLITRFKEIDTTGARTRFWFDAEILAARWWQDRLDEAVQAARPRYVPELSVRIPATQHALAALCGDEGWAQQVSADIARVEKLNDGLRGSAFGGREEVSEPNLTAVRALGSELVDALVRWRENPTEATAVVLQAALAAVQAAGTSAETAEMARLDAAHQSGWDTPSWRQWNAEYMVSFPAAAVDALRELNSFLAELSDRVVGPTGRLRTARNVMVTSPAGMGKTFVTLDYVCQRLRAGGPSVFLHGRHFRDGPILEQLRVLVGLPTDLNGNDVLALLDQAGKSAECPVLLVVDALNESRPRTIWRDELDTLITKINRFEHLRVVFTLRSHYRAQVLPDELVIPEIVHRGFDGVEYDAFREYADFYHLEPPAAPPIQAEFSSPLFLRLLCEAFKERGRLTLEEATIGLDELVDLLLNQINRRISNQLNAPVADQIVHQAMYALAERLGSGTHPWIDRTSAHTLLQTIWPGRTTDKSLLEALVGEGLLAEDIDPAASGPRRNVVTMAFERLGQHLVILAATSELNDQNQVHQALSAGSLRQLLRLDTEPDPGLLEALSVVLGHRGLELTAFRDQVGELQAIAASVAGLPWRSETSITEATIDCIDAALHQSKTFREAMDMLFRLAPRPGHLLNADYLDALLSARSMAAVDAFLTPWLHKTREGGGAAHRLISWARDRDISRTNPETCRLWVTALTWCTSCPDRRIRDDATIGAARLLIAHPGLVPDFLGQFLNVVDDWVTERACYAAYTALLRSGTATQWQEAAQAVWNTMFADEIPMNASLRDEARRIVEAAAERGALPADVDLTRVAPPYPSAWPTTWPTPEDVERYQEDRDNYPKLHFSCTADDFYTYIIETALRDRPGINVAAAARRILLDAVELGYEPSHHAPFDHHVLDTYGRGRSKPSWIERIGKKYQWIAFARLLGQINDHVSPARDRWSPPEPPMPGPQSTRLRQMDPTVCDAEPDAVTSPRSHVAEYAWDAYDQAPSPEAWIADDTGLPDPPVEFTGDTGPQVILAGNYDWRREAEQNKNIPTLWAHLVSLFVKTSNLNALLAELAAKDLAHAVSQVGGARYGDGFVGEYPFGQHYGAEAHIYMHEHDEAFGVPTIPTTVDIIGEYEYSLVDRISLIAPTPILFGPAPGALNWDGKSAWRDAEGRPIAAVRNVYGEGQNELTIDQDWLENWLDKQEMAIVWLELLGKDVMRDGSFHNSHPGRLLRSRARHRTAEGHIAALEPYYERIPAWHRDKTTDASTSGK
ncbi:hypothetical protein AB0N50_35945 [Streptomyces pharetrae]|uniref:hypothetical protein n=1 Tax=Streptomyces pharetrae TaxID=291370 RepID=UPI00345F91FA